MYKLYKDGLKQGLQNLLQDFWVKNAGAAYFPLTVQFNINIRFLHNGDLQLYVTETIKEFGRTYFLQL